jgi:hypothetical protein
VAELYDNVDLPQNEPPPGAVVGERQGSR